MKSLNGPNTTRNSRMKSQRLKMKTTLTKAIQKERTREKLKMLQQRITKTKKQAILIKMAKLFIGLAIQLNAASTTRLIPITLWIKVYLCRLII